MSIIVTSTASLIRPANPIPIFTGMAGCGTPIRTCRTCTTPIAMSEGIAGAPLGGESAPVGSFVLWHRHFRESIINTRNDCRK
jgi:hypothetical protein